MYPTQYNIGEVWEYTDKKGRKTTGKIKNIARMYGGAVLAFFDSGRGFPITRHGVWRHK